GRDALCAVRDRGPARHTVGLICDGPPFPIMERLWSVSTPDGHPAGEARWAVYSFALERNIAVVLVDAGLDAAGGFVVNAPDGPRRGAPHPIPFV
ncbi:MAG TPA: hypothetical protein VIM27_09145, partial [Gaiellales bacterium]